MNSNAFARQRLQTKLYYRPGNAQAKCHFGMGSQDEDSRHFENEVACSSRELTSLLREREWNIAGRSGVSSLAYKSFWSPQFRRTNPRLDVKDY
ncbi:hypothetical protein PGT21_011275 [Puccinia graminis f. sp. tritici]|uniref:Uncharacterized protein n=1 Tax=Puccinia graminis f. sp. tritici TaxID=56615 RepID=A0A5B0NTY8_PUCGR|nr:hypothetical protein PGT21_011275 [Puccinia graminis f. sp. tritici]KAA1093789.1 hypothetical protein PGTUg99_029494 [Puccinia graminis f. sp. tritici]